MCENLRLSAHLKTYIFSWGFENTDVSRGNRRSSEEKNCEKCVTLVYFSGKMGGMARPIDRPLHYMLNPDHSLRPAELLEWARWHEHSYEERSVGLTIVGPYRVSTMFLGLDHQFGDGPPMIFETCVFDSSASIEDSFCPGRFIEHSEVQDRCSTWDQAVEMHAQVVARLEAETGCTRAEMPRAL
jgi:hypothetical protein